MATDMNARPNEVAYYLGIAEAVAKKSTCLRRKYGAVIVNRGEVVSTGYNGAPRGCANCTDIGFCIRNLIGVEQGADYNKCRSVHAEMNAMLSASRQEMIGSTIYIVGLQPNPKTGQLEYASSQPCLLCHRMMINAGIKECIGYMREFDPSRGALLDDCVKIVSRPINISGKLFDLRIYHEYEPIIRNEKAIGTDLLLEKLGKACGVEPGEDD